MAPQSQLKPLQKRAADVGELVAKARALAAERIAAVTIDAGIPAATSDADKTSEKSLTQLTADAVRLVLPERSVTAVLAETTALAALQRAKPALISAQVEANAADTPAGARERVLAAGRAVRMIEAAAYAEIYAQRYAAFSAAVIAMPQDIQASHKRTCTCGK